MRADSRQALADGWPIVLTSVVIFVSADAPASRALRRYVDALPTAVIAALAGAATIAPADTLTRGAEPIAAAAAALVALMRRNLLLAVLAGVGTLALLRGVGLGQ